MSEFKWRSAVVSLAMIAATAWLAAAQTPPPARRAGAAPQAPTPPAAVATIGPLRVAQIELDQRTDQAVSQYKSQSGASLPPEIMVVVRRQILEGLIRRDLLVLEAQRRNLVATEKEAEAELRHDPFFQVNGVFDSTRYNQFRMQNPIVVQNAIQQLRLSLGGRRLMEQLQRQKGPAESVLRARARRALMRASVDYMGLRRADFDGATPEPRESEIHGYYRDHAAEFERPQRAILSVVFVDQPALSDSEGAIPAAVKAWNSRMKQRADSILAAVRGGSELEAASGSQGGPRGGQVVVPGNFPAYWKGDARITAAVFSARDSSLLPEAVPSTTGWLVVRVDRNEPAHLAAFREVAPEIRMRLRNERRQTFEDRELHAMYDAVRDSLKTTAYRLRYGIADTARLAPPAPPSADLERFYRSHLADYSSFSSKEGGVAVKSLDEVRDDVRRRWSIERRFELSRLAADELRASWGRGRRDAALERRLEVREVGPVVPGAAADSGGIGRLLGDTLAARGGALGAGMARTDRGWVAFQVAERVPDWAPDFAQARPALMRRLQARRDEEDLEGARRLFDANPQAFAGGDVIHYERAIVTPPQLLDVPLTREEVERYYREHLDRYSAPELVGARHILISPRDATAEADKEARARADSILARLRDGDDFAAVAEKTTDDPATKVEGGDLGVFGRGTMLPEFEHAAFAMRPGDLSQTPVRTQVGYHIIKVYSYDPMVTNPLNEVYSNASSDAAQEKADSLARGTADSLWRTLKTPAQLRAAAERRKIRVITYAHTTGKTEVGADDLRPYYRRLETLKPGQVFPGIQKFPGMGYAITWVDSLSPPRPPTWDEARDQALDSYRRDAGRRALGAKQAELDSLLREGWSLDSIGVAWGGLGHADDYGPGQRLVGVGTAGRIDTVVFGDRGDDGLRPGQLSDWIELPAGVVRLRLKELHAPSASAVTTRAENDARIELERSLVGYFDGLKKRYPVRILDRKLREVQLPQPPSGP
ncbi:MAG TPA: peptidyl-prolyl cis-trans isomerase [Terriglobales bacterium]|nr:peptidyl-prolyl cis-trans isomerase [Terriglobales bacterium]